MGWQLSENYENAARTNFFPLFMRFLSCKVHCPFIYFCKPSPHIYNSGPPRLQNGPQLPATLVSVSSASDQSPAEITEVKDESLVVAKENCNHRHKSSLKSVTSDPKPQQKKQVQWMDFLGGELAEIREYEVRWVISSLSISAQKFNWSCGCLSRTRTRTCSLIT